MPTYDASQVTLIMGGKVINGFSEDSFITAERNEDTFTLVIGVDGFGTRAKTNNYSGRITVNLQQSSPGNDILQAFATADEQSNTGSQPCILRDASGRTLVTAATAWVVKPPSIEFTRSVADRQWIIETDRLNISVGGN